MSEQRLQSPDRGMALPIAMLKGSDCLQVGTNLKIYPCAKRDLSGVKGRSEGQLPKILFSKRMKQMQRNSLYLMLCSLNIDKNYERVGGSEAQG